MAPDAILVGDLEILPHEHGVRVAGRLVDLTSREFDIVLRLAEHPGWVYSAEQLADGEGEESDFSPDSISVHVSHLRRKLAQAGAPGVVATVRGVGYRLQQPEGGQRPAVGAQDGVPAARCADSPASGDPQRRLRDAFWELEEAVLQAEHSGSEEQLAQAVTALDEARRAVYGLLAE